jgi:hypothetical protein
VPFNLAGAGRPIDPIRLWNHSARRKAGANGGAIGGCCAQLDVPLRTYTLYVGKMAEAQTIYTELGFLALKKVATTRTSSGISSPTRG